jgi:hypothetical protein
LPVSLKLNVCRGDYSPSSDKAAAVGRWHGDNLMVFLRGGVYTLG